MATKEENINRLHELAELLGRDVDITGSAAEINQRVMEWEEEAGDGSTSDDSAGTQHVAGTGKAPPIDERSGSAQEPGWVAVRVLKTMHITAKIHDGAPVSELVQAGDEVLIPAQYLSELIQNECVSVI